MKLRLILSLLWGTLIFALSAQEYKTPPNLPHYEQKRWHFGFTIGPEFQNNRITNNSENVVDYMGNDMPDIIPDEIKYFSEVPNANMGFHVGIISSLRINNVFNLRLIPSLSLGYKEFYSQQYLNNGGTWSKGELTKNEINSTYISCPALIKYRAMRIQDVGPYIIAGANIKYDLATDDGDPITLKKMDIGLEFGLGSDFYMQTFRLGVEIRFGIGLLNTLKPNTPGMEDPSYLTASMDKIMAKTFTIAINFE